MVQFLYIFTFRKCTINKMEVTVDVQVHLHCTGDRADSEKHGPDDKVQRRECTFAL